MQVKKAFITSLPVLAGYIVLGTGFGILLREAGYGVIWALVMAITVYSGTLQYVGVSLLAGAAGIVQTIITSIAVNARHVFYGISMIKKYKNAGIYKPYIIFALTDETYSLLSSEEPKDCDINLYRFLVSLFNQCYWITGCVLGNLIGQILPFDATGIEFSMTAIFVASFVEQWINKKNRLSAVIGLVTTIVCLLVFDADIFLIPAMLIITLILTIIYKRDNKKGAAV